MATTGSHDGHTWLVCHPGEYGDDVKLLMGQLLDAKSKRPVRMGADDLSFKEAARLYPWAPLRNEYINVSSSFNYRH